MAEVHVALGRNRGDGPHQVSGTLACPDHEHSLPSVVISPFEVCDVEDLALVLLLVGRDHRLVWRVNEASAN